MFYSDKHSGYVGSFQLQVYLISATFDAFSGTVVTAALVGATVYAILYFHLQV